MKGARVQAVVRELGNERIDIVHWDPDLITFVRHALSPANIVKYFEVPGSLRLVIVIADEDLAQAIGRNGQNVKLASQLVEHELDVFGEKEWSEKSDEDKQKILTARPSEIAKAEAFRAKPLCSRKKWQARLNRHRQMNLQLRKKLRIRMVRFKE